MRHPGALLVGFGLVAGAMVPFAAHADAADGGVAGSPECLARLCDCLKGQPDAGVPTPRSIWTSEKAGVVSLAIPSDVTAGSDVGAGLDVNAVQEVLHPDSLKSMQVSVRQAGGVFKDARTSIALQFNPYMVAHGNDLVYEQLVDERRRLYGRLAQDTVVTFALAPETPYVGETFATGRFATAGLGFSTDLLGLRSVYSPEYSDCLHDKAFAATVGAFIRTHTKPPDWDQREGESEEERDKRHANTPRLAAYDKAVAEQVERLRQHVRECSAKYVKGDRLAALFFSGGARAVTPGPSRQRGDTVVAQRLYLAVSGSLFAVKDWELAAQVRAIAERPQSTSPMARWVDGGFSVAYAGTGFRFSMEGTQAFIAGTAPVGTLSGGIRFKVHEKVSLQIGFSGTAPYLWNALNHAAIGIAAAYEEGKVVGLGLPMGMLPLPH